MKRVILTILRFISALFATLIPNRKKIWLFSSWMGGALNDNPRAFFDYLQVNSDIRCIWILKCRKELKVSQRERIEAYYYLSVKGIYFQLVAEFVFFTHGIISEFNSAFIGYNTKRVNLWHGMPIKKIGFDDKKFATRTPFEKYYWYRFVRNEIHDYYVSIGHDCTSIYESAFNVEKNKILETGFPRNDLLLKGSTIVKNGEFLSILYMPTFREQGDDIFDFDFNIIDELCHQNNIKIFIKLHPVVSVDYPTLSTIERTQNISIVNVENIYDSLGSYDVLVSDISSVIFDFALLDREIYLLSSDLNDYEKSERELYSHAESVRGRMINNWTELFSIIGSIDSCKNFSPVAINYHKNKDFPFSSCQRLYEALLKKEDDNE
ncbi:CDP-glycerol glycerophosphotransferase family protein [Vibrio splendidus]|uniref:CDP-glycerol glycerophosphotransferase family protein n=1 Tax=Vibrio splendidus TaxID=29497 RepID=UPI000D383435|nr:CDP-glycerol glycerophosphotransferase family protein [Vibrio splendidus]PTO68218.1 hypothetical protein CWN81_20540 [Vibrio splendidus]PTP81872.1 hypothetical protein CWO03_22755 [Vibrio splendidus]